MKLKKAKEQAVPEKPCRATITRLPVLDGYAPAYEVDFGNDVRYCTELSLFEVLRQGLRPSIVTVDDDFGFYYE